jgi:hypothetical protein
MRNHPLMLHRNDMSGGSSPDPLHEGNSGPIVSLVLWFLLG